MTDEQTTSGPIDNSHLMARTTPDKQDPPKQEAQAATVVADDGNNSVESAPPENDDAKPAGKKPGVHNRIGELTKEKHDAKREAEAAQREAEYWRQQALKVAEQNPEPTQAEAPTGEPTREQFDFDDAKFMRAWYKWSRDQERAEESKQKQAEESQKRYQGFLEKERAFTALHPDYEAVARAEHVPITPDMRSAILECDEPPAIAYYLGQNLEEAHAIAQMSPIAAARAIGRIEAKLSAKPSVPAPITPTKTVTRAPEPVTTLSGSPVVTRSYDEMSMDEYDAVRRKERAAKGLPP
jgi:hypothetical protein